MFLPLIDCRICGCEDRLGPRKFVDPSEADQSNRPMEANIDEHLAKRVCCTGNVSSYLSPPPCYGLHCHLYLSIRLKAYERSTMCDALRRVEFNKAVPGPSHHTLPKAFVSLGLDGLAGAAHCLRGRSFRVLQGPSKVHGGIKQWLWLVEARTLQGRLKRLQPRVGQAHPESSPNSSA